MQKQKGSTIFTQRLVSMNKIFSIIAAATLLGFSSCQDKYDICDQEKTVNFRGVFYTKTLSGEAETPVQSLTISPINTSSTIYNQTANVSAFAFPLNPTVNAAQYVIKIDNSAIKDTISLIYTSATKTLSVECGDIITHSLASAATTIHNLDSVKISNSKIDNSIIANLKLYY